MPLERILSKTTETAWHSIGGTKATCILAPKHPGLKFRQKGDDQFKKKSQPISFLSYCINRLNTAVSHVKALPKF